MSEERLRAFLKTPEMQRRIARAREDIRLGRTKRGKTADELRQLARDQRR